MGGEEERRRKGALDLSVSTRLFFAQTDNFSRNSGGDAVKNAEKRIEQKSGERMEG